METEILCLSHEQFQQLYEAMDKRNAELQQPSERSSVLADLHAKAEDHSVPHIHHKSKAKEEIR